jgi:hypothetical protein
VRVVIEVGGWEHDCCGPAYELDSTVEVDCLELSGPDPSTTRFVESHHEAAPRSDAVTHKGRVADLAIVHPDGSIESLHRLPSGRALRGFDRDDDGHLEQPWNGQPVVRDSSRFLVTLLV